MASARTPTTVRAAAGILVGMAVGGLGYGVTILVALSGIVDRFRAGAAGTGADRVRIDAMVTLLRLVAVVNMIVAVLMTVLLIVLARGLLAGRRGARIGTWAVCGLGLICGFAGAVGLVAQRVVPFRSASDSPAVADLLRVLVDAYPSWWIGWAGGVSVAQALGYLLVAVLLVVSPAEALPRPSGASGWPVPAVPPDSPVPPAPLSPGAPPR